MDIRKFLMPSAFKILGTLVLSVPLSLLLSLLFLQIGLFFETIGNIPAALFLYAFTLVFMQFLSLVVSYLIFSVLESRGLTLPKSGFLKPTYSKLLITLALFVASIYIRGLVVAANSVVVSALEFVLSPHYLLYLLLFSRGGDVITFLDLFFSLIVFVLGFVYWYLVACAVAWAYKKYSGESKQTKP